MIIIACKLDKYVLIVVTYLVVLFFRSDQQKTSQS